MECATHGEPPPAELRQAWECERWKTLPEPGGLNDQEYSLLTRMAVLDNVYSTVHRFRNLHGEQINYLTTSERRLIRYLIDQGLFMKPAE